MAVTFESPILFGNSSAASDHIVLCGALHSLVGIHPPKLETRDEFFWGSQSSIFWIAGSQNWRNLVVNAIVSDSTLSSRLILDNYLEEIERYLGSKMTLSVTYSSGPVLEQSFDNVFFKGIDRVPQNKNKLPITLPNYISSPVGPTGNYWHEVNLNFIQAQIPTYTPIPGP